MTMAPPEWYPDPSGRNERRYWNGTAWTEFVWSAGQQGIDPIKLAPISVSSNEQEPKKVPSTAGDISASPSDYPSDQTKSPSLRETKRQGRDEFESISLSAAHGDPNALVALPAAIERAMKVYRGKALAEKKWDVLTTGIRDVLQDDRLSEAEEGRLRALSSALGLDLQKLADRDLRAFEELVIAGLNDGRLPTADVPIALKPGEVGRASFDAVLMKEVAIRKMRGGSKGFNIHIAKGVNYRTAQVRVHSVVVGTHLQVQDRGVLTVTNQRAVFAGQARTLEFRFDKLVGIEQFKDGLRINVSNRQLASLFRITPPSSPLIAAALITKSMT
ncbi:DUF2510 domain-containing protein [Leifsonia sp. A12D58]|uniref:DUF2510 domain-containing protein n=1 Tax=Leifsonia sp. A12D58 TaxID=3397674 RepID=UPI0039DF2CCF